MTHMNSVRPGSRSGWVRAKRAEEREVLGIKRVRAETEGDSTAGSSEQVNVGQEPRTIASPHEPTPQE
eukprot:11978590-Karenia_brevis.AAC.1